MLQVSTKLVLSHQNNSKIDHLLPLSSILEELLPQDFFSDQNTPEEMLEQFDSFLPFISWSSVNTAPGTISIVLIAPVTHRNMAAFFSYMTRNHLVAGKELDTLIYRNQEFFFEGFEESRYVFCENTLRLETPLDLKTVQKNLPLIATKIRKVIMESRPTNPLLKENQPKFDVKCDLIIKDLYYLIQKQPNFFKQDLFLYFQQLCVSTNSQFFSLRNSRHISRVLVTQYTYLKNLQRNLIHLPYLRHVSIRIMRTTLEFPIGKREVLGIVLGWNQINENEIFTLKHALKAVQQIVDDIQLITRSETQIKEGSVHTLYFEISKTDGTVFSKKEHKVLKQRLHGEVRTHIEKTTHTLFSPRNEEVTFQHAIALGKSLNKPSDPTKLFVEFKEQTANQLVFLCIIVRPIRLEDPPLSQLLQNANLHFSVIFDQVKILGNIDEEYVKEANILQIKLNKFSFLREDGSIHLMRATFTLKNIITQALGTVEDVNLQEDAILKTIFEELKDHLQLPGNTGLFRLENFFYSFHPEEIKNLQHREALEKAAALFLKQSSLSRKTNDIILKSKPAYCSILIQTEQKEAFSIVENRLDLIDIDPNRLIKSCIELHGIYYITLIYEDIDQNKRALLSDAVTTAIEKLETTAKKKQTLRIALPSTALSLFNPQGAYDQEGGTILRMLYEGLMRYGRNGQLNYALCERSEVSEDFKTYRFFLRPSTWSDGSAVTAYDFEYAWKRMIDPKNETVNGYLFFGIKNAKNAYEGKVSLDEVGISCEDPYVLRVELETPNNAFLEYTTHFAYFPYPRHQQNRHQVFPISNGPFVTDSWQKNSFLKLKKNPFYVDIHRVKLENIDITIVDDEASNVEMFNRDELDWAGKPMFAFTQQQKDLYKGQGILKFASSLSRMIVGMNNDVFPFNNKKIRNALSLCIDRKHIVEEITKQNEPILKSLSPSELALTKESLIKPCHPKEAQKLFAEGLKELDVDKKDLKPISFIYYYSQTSHKIVTYLKECWTQYFDLELNLTPLVWPEFCERLVHGNYDLALLKGYSITRDIISHFSSYRSKKNKINRNNFAHPKFSSLLEESILETDPEKQQQLFIELEAFLVEQMPEIPLFATLDSYVKKDYICGEILLPSGDIDFVETYIAIE